MIHHLAVLAILLSLAACAGRSRAADSLVGVYRFTEGDVWSCRVESRLAISLAGSDAEFLKVEPFSFAVEGVFENRVMNVDDVKATALLERRVRNLSSNGEWSGAAFGVSWDREKGTSRTQPDSEHAVNKFVLSMCEEPRVFSVDSSGRTTVQVPEHGRFVQRQGMMYWPLRRGAVQWTSVEEIAIPLLHDKVRIVFENAVVRIERRRGRDVAVVKLTPRLPSLDRAPDFVKADDRVDYGVSGEGTFEFDDTAGRLLSLDLKIKIGISGSSGRIAGTVFFEEKQSLIE